MTKSKLQQISEETGIDVQAAVQAVYDLAKHVAASEAHARYAALSGQPQSKREQRLADELAEMRRDAEKLLTVNRHLWDVMHEEHRFIGRGALHHCIKNALAAKDYTWARQLRDLKIWLESGAPRKRKKYTRKRKKAKQK